MAVPFNHMMLFCGLTTLSPTPLPQAGEGNPFATLRVLFPSPALRERVAEEPAPEVILIVGRERAYCLWRAI